MPFFHQQPRKKNVNLILRCFMLLILIVSIGVFLSKMITYSELLREKEQLELQKQTYETTIAELEYRINNPIDYDEIVRIAREKLNLAFPDDTVFYNEQDHIAPH